MLEILRCPACGAADNSPASPDHTHTCSFCSVRYTVRTTEASAPKPTPTAPTSPATVQAPVAAWVLGLAAVALVVLGVAREQRKPPPDPLPVAAVPVPAALTISAPAEVAPEPAASATFVEHRIRKEGDSYWILGVVTNTSPWAIDRPQLDIVYMDAAGKEVGVATGYAGSDPLAPGTSVPVNLLASKPPAHASHRVEPHVQKLSYDPGILTTFDHEEYAPSLGILGEWNASGSVTNSGTAPARFVSVRVTAWDDNDTVLGVEYAYAAGEEGLAPGATGRYSTHLYTGGQKPARFTTQITGRK